MVVPTRFASVRSSNKGRPAIRKASFRDDTNLVSLRYEKTVPAEPPIPLPPRNPRRTTPTSTTTVRRSASTATSFSTTSAATSVVSFASAASNSTISARSHRPVVVSPPSRAVSATTAAAAVALPARTPPTEQHPALRTPVQPTPDEWKRDSGHGSTPISPTKIREEDSERENSAGRDAPYYTKADELSSGASVPPAVEHVENRENSDICKNRAVEGRASSLSSDNPGASRSRIGGAAVGAGAGAAATPPNGTSTSTTPKRPPRLQKTPPTSSSSSPSSTKKLARSFSFRSPKKLTGDRAIAGVAPMRMASQHEHPHPPPEQPLMRGEQPPASASATAATTAAVATNDNKEQSEPPKSPTRASSWSWLRSPRQSDAPPVAPSDSEFSPLAISIPTDSLLEDDFMTSLSFSKRGSIMFGGRKDATADQQRRNRSAMANNTAADVGSLNGAMGQLTTSTAGDDHGPHDSLNDNQTAAADPSIPSLDKAQSSATQSTTTTTTTTTATTITSPERPDSPQHSVNVTTARDLGPPPDIRVLAADVEKESQKVRSLYQTGDAIRWEDGARHSFCEHLDPTPEVPAEEDENDSVPTHLTPIMGTPRSGSSFSQYHDVPKRENELAGGLEDWEDVDGADVDRYGFISVPRPGSRVSTPTELKSAQFSPRRRTLLQKRDPMGFSSPLGGRRTPSRKVSARSLNTQHSEMSTTSVRSSRSVLRQAGNLLPQNRHRRWMDEAGDMLTVSPSLQDLVEEAQIEKLTEGLKRKEWERSEKWRKMAKVVRNGDQGAGMEFEFDTKNPKLVERTWKGVPDRWRGAAWWSFLAASASRNKDSATAEDIMAAFHRLQERSSPDDVQIDLDVPRTISRHIMFRRRYRGGQRLLFRVLHALSIYFPTTGYVQGMASLAATLLCYFDEEKCFVMLVRMWQLRGLDRLYQPGFEGLLDALREFDTAWLNKDVAAKLTELCIDPTAYGTRWYLTLFNLSIPFPAQLRVWDVFLLLGDDTLEPTATNTPTGTTAAGSNTTQLTGGLDILHATSAALIQALGEVLLDSDFENAMKALTSWISIKDEDLLMKVTKAEWKIHHQGKKKA